MFVEEGEAVYRWEFGESLFPHCHSGIIVKASSIINPHYRMSKNNPHPMNMKKTDKTVSTEEATMEEEKEEKFSLSGE